MVKSPKELRVNQASINLLKDSHYWWLNSREGLIVEFNGNLGWKELNQILHEKFYPTYVRKDKANEFAHIKMGKINDG